MSANHLYTAMQRGTVDGTILSFASATPYSVNEVATHMSENASFGTSASWIGMSQEYFDSLSPEDQAVIEELSGVALARSAGHAWDIQDAKANAAMDKEGIQRHEADPALVAKVQEEADRLKAQWKEEVAKLGVDGDAVMKALDAELAKARAEVKQQ